MDSNSQTEEGRKIYIVGGLLYGDEGKGTTVEYLVKITKATLVVRYNGGAQAAHHIVLPNKTWHCFSQFGSGSFYNYCHCLLSKLMFVFPHAMVREADVLIGKGVKDVWNRTHIDYDCFIITPYHQLVTRVAEILRGKKKHGSTGLGVGICADEAFIVSPQTFPKGTLLYEKDKLSFQDPDSPPKHTCLQIKDLLNKDLLSEKIALIIREKVDYTKKLIEEFKSMAKADNASTHDISLFHKEYYEIYKNEFEFEGVNDTPTIEGIIKEAQKLCYKCIIDHNAKKLCEFYLNFAEKYGFTFCEGKSIIKEEYITKKQNIIFEGAQGSLLDRVFGIYPHLTKTLCSDDNALHLIKEIESEEGLKMNYVKIGVLRAYSSRHGNGPFVTDTQSLYNSLKEDHNINSQWQGEFKVGPFDFIAANYGVEIFRPDYLSLTCIDRLLEAASKEQLLEDFPFCTSYQIPESKLNDDILGIIMKDDLFEAVKNQEGSIDIRRIKKRGDLDAYLSLDLLKVMKNAQPVYTSLKDLLASEKEDDKEKLSITQKLVQVIESKLNIRIAMISQGPTYRNKGCLVEEMFE